MSCKRIQSFPVNNSIQPTVKLASRASLQRTVTIPAALTQAQLDDWVKLFDADSPGVLSWMVRDVDGVGFEWAYESLPGDRFGTVPKFGRVTYDEDVGEIWVKRPALNKSVRIEYHVLYSPLKDMNLDRTTS
jgi:hypothetical protein